MPRKVGQQAKETSTFSKEKKITKAVRKREPGGQEKSEQDEQMMSDQMIPRQVFSRQPVLDVSNEEVFMNQDEQAKDNIDQFINSEIQRREPNLQQIDAEGDQNDVGQDVLQASSRQIQNGQDNGLGQGVVDNYSQSQEQHQDQCQNGSEGQQNSNSGSSGPIIPALQDMQFRKVRGTRIQDLIQGKVKIDDYNLVEKQVNSYLGVKPKPKRKEQDNAHGKSKHRKGKKEVVSDSENSVYDYNKEDSSDQQDYIQSSSGRDQFDSDFDLTESYPGKRGRKKGSKSKKRGRGRGRPPLNPNRVQRVPTQKVPGRKRGRPPKNRPVDDGQFRPEPERKPAIKRENNENPVRGKRRGRPRKYPLPDIHFLQKPQQKAESVKKGEEGEQAHNQYYQKREVDEIDKQRDMLVSQGHMKQSPRPTNINMMPIHNMGDVMKTDHIASYEQLLNLSMGMGMGMNMNMMGMGGEMGYPMRMNMPRNQPNQQ